MQQTAERRCFMRFVPPNRKPVYSVRCRFVDARCQCRRSGDGPGLSLSSGLIMAGCVNGLGVRVGYLYLPTLRDKPAKNGTPEHPWLKNEVIPQGLKPPSCLGVKEALKPWGPRSTHWSGSSVAVEGFPCPGGKIDSGAQERLGHPVALLSLWRGTGSGRRSWRSRRDNILARIKLIQKCNS